jgi:hypothetical protein
MAGNKEMLYHHCFGICHQEGPREPGGTDTEWVTSAFGLCHDVNIVEKTLIPYRKTQKPY